MTCPGRGLPHRGGTHPYLGLEDRLDVGRRREPHPLEVLAVGVCCTRTARSATSRPSRPARRSARSRRGAAVRSFQGEPLGLVELPESRVLTGESITGELIRIRPPGRERDAILSVNGQPARDANGSVVAAVMLSREVSEEIAMAIEVRRLASERDWDASPMQAR